MRRVTLPGGVRPPAEWWLALAIAVAELAVALTGVHAALLAGLALLAPGWALAPLLPDPVRRHRLAAAAAAPTLGFAVTSTVLITISRVGIPLTGLSIRVAVFALLAVGLLVWSRSERPARVAGDRAALAQAAGLAAIVVLGVVLAWRVVGGLPVPGNDWAKYVLYADEIGLHHKLLIDNPFWMLGVPFREDPGVPSVYGSVLIMSGAQAAVLSRAIVVFAVLEILAVFAFARAFWGRVAGLLAAALVAFVPATQDILGWHGLANAAALALLGLALSYLAALAQGRLDRRSLVGAALVLVAMIAAHRLTLLLTLGASGLVLLACVATGAARRTLLDAARIAVATLVLGAGVIADVIARQRTFGGTLPYSDYLTSKVDVGNALRDISPVLAVAAIVSLGVIAWRRRSDRALWPAVALLIVTVALAYAWIVHVPTYYGRMVYYVPVAAAPLVAAVAARVRPAWALATVAAAALAFTWVTAYRQAANVRTFYAFANPASLKGLDAVAADLKPDEIVVTDRCWSFLSTWLLHARTLPALTPQDIQPKAELPFARQAQAILDATPAGMRRARQLGVRYLLVDPQCRAADGRPLDPPAWGTPVYVSERLAVLKLPA